MKKIFSLTFLIFSTIFCFSQIPIPFKVRYQTYVNGDMSIIANNITNRVDSNSANIPYTSRTNMHKLNDEFFMNYIDIDNDPSTFSSSSAVLNLENSSSKKIIYAGLYWSATYLCKSSHMVKETEFIIDDPKRESFNEIKIKLPNQENYLDIKGEVIFDGLNIKKFKESAPYAVYADITKEVLKLNNPFGNYTVANIKATTGTISGGVAAGWTLFFIYEDTQMKGKFITSFDGFAGVSDRLVEIVFTGFKTLPQGNVEAKIAGSTLEGDYNLKGDQLLFKTTSKNKYLPLSSLLRDETNFFNSSITIGNDYFMSRKPDSKNTLGYDAFLLSIPNPDNTVIGNNSKEATIRLKSSGDRSFLFFTAFNVAVTEQEKPIIPVEIKQELITTISDSVKKTEIIPNTITNTEDKPIDKSLNSNSDIISQQIKKQEVVVANNTIIPEEKIKSEIVKVPEQKDIVKEVINNTKTTTIVKSNNAIDLLKKPEINQEKEISTIINNNKIVVTQNLEKSQTSIAKTDNNKTDILETKDKDSQSIIVPIVSENKETSNKIIYNNTQDAVANTENKTDNKKLIVDDSKTILVTEKNTTNEAENKLPKIVETKIIPVGEEITVSEIANKIIPVTENTIIKSESNSQIVDNSKLTPEIDTKKDILKESTKIQTITETAKVNNKDLNSEEIFNYNIEGVNKEYYIIANVFAKERNKRNFVKFLKNKGYNADYFYNPIKKYYYVYIDKGLDKDKIKALHETKINNSYKDEIWVLSVNMPKTTEAVVVKEIPKVEVKQQENIVNTTIPKENTAVEAKTIAAIATTEKPSEIQKSELDLITTKANVKSTVNKPSERIDAITDKNLEDKNTKVKLVETDLNSLPSLQTTKTENAVVNKSTENEIIISKIDKQTETSETQIPIETISVNNSQPIVYQNNISLESQKAEEKKEENPVVVLNDSTQNISKIAGNNSVISTPVKIIENKNISETVNAQNIQPKTNELVTNIDVNTNSKIENNYQFKKEEILNYNFDGLTKGYYIIANVFAKQRNSINFVNALKRKGIMATSFYNPIKKYYYVYIERSNDKAEIEGLYNSKVNNTYKDTIWVLSINNPIKQEILVKI